MHWYAAHIVMCVRFKSGSQEKFPVWENVLLLCSGSEEDAFDKAEEIGRQSASDDGQTFRWGRRAARWEFVGVRKLVECSLSGNAPRSGDEVTYTELQFDSLTAVQEFAAGNPVRADIDEKYRDMTEIVPASNRAGAKKRA